MTYLAAALQRGYMCESLEAAGADKATGAGFLVGLLSTLDSVLNVPMTQILEHVRLASDIREALTEHSGKLGQLLAYTVAYKSGDTKTLDQCGIDSELLRDVYWRAIEQAQATLQELSVWKA